MIVIFCKKRVFVDKMSCSCQGMSLSSQSFLLPYISFEIPGVCVIFAVDTFS